MYEFNVFELWDEDVTYADEKRQSEKKAGLNFFQALFSYPRKLCLQLRWSFFHLVSMVPSQQPFVPHFNNEINKDSNEINLILHRNFILLYTKPF